MFLVSRSFATVESLYGSRCFFYDFFDNPVVSFQKSTFDAQVRPGGGKSFLLEMSERNLNIYAYIE